MQNIVFIIFTCSDWVPELHVDFNRSCNEFMILNVQQDYLYLNKTNELHLWIMQNSPYEVYSAPLNEAAILSWPDKSINSIPRNLFMKDGNMKYPLVFEHENVMCQMLVIRGGTLNIEYQDVTVYKCQKNRDWWLIVAIISFFILAVLVPVIIW